MDGTRLAAGRVVVGLFMARGFKRPAGGQKSILSETQGDIRDIVSGIARDVFLALLRLFQVSGYQIWCEKRKFAERNQAIVLIWSALNSSRC